MDARKFLVGALAGALLGLPAMAQDEPVDEDITIDRERERDRDRNLEPGDRETTIVVEDDGEQEGKGGSGNQADMRGLTVTLGGGVEGYTGDLAPQINPGAGWGLNAQIRPTSVIGLEFGYTGAVNDIDTGAPEHVLEPGPGAVAGPDIVRNGGHLAATVGLSATAVQPYLMGGVGLDRYNVRAPTGEFNNDTTGNIPVGLGLRTHIGDFTADARVAYSVLFDNQFAVNVRDRDVGPLDSTSGGRWRGTLNLGATF